MKPMPMVAIVGRPNVGKSALYNRITGKAQAIVEDRPGVTRDRLLGRADWRGREFWLVDTGGYDPETDKTGGVGTSEKELRKGMNRQVKLAVERADKVLLVVDGKVGLHTLDERAARMLRESGKETLLLINKSDRNEDAGNRWDFSRLNLGEGHAVSALHGRGVDEALDMLIEGWPVNVEPPAEPLPPIEGEEEGEPARPSLPDRPLRVAIVGRPNVGKSSLFNALAHEERQIVSDKPGTTRDAINTMIQVHGVDIELVDTAGLRKKDKVDDAVEYYAAVRAVRAIDSCDVGLLVVDASFGLGEQEERIAGLIHEAGKACVVVVNKWDLPEKDNLTLSIREKEIRSRLNFMDYALICFISVKTGQRIGEVLELALEAGSQHGRRLGTGALNRAMDEIKRRTPLPSRRGKTLKIYFLAQVGIRPPSFALFVNDPKLLHFSTKRRISKLLREKFELRGTPLILMLRRRHA